MSKPTQELRAEIAATCEKVKEAAEKLLAMANLLDADPFPLVAPEKLRDLGWSLAGQGGRLSMALELTGKPPRPRCALCPAPLTRDGLCSRAACPNSD